MPTKKTYDKYKKRYIKDEMCSCGHLKSVHLPAKPHPIAGHGACIAFGCSCRKFTRTRFVYEGE